MGDVIREIKRQIRSADNARIELMRRIDKLQDELSEQFMDRVRQKPSGSRVDDDILQLSHRLDDLEEDYLELETHLRELQEALIDLMGSDTEE